MINRVTSLAACLLIVHHISADQNITNQIISNIDEIPYRTIEWLKNQMEAQSTEDLNLRYNADDKNLKDMTALMEATKKLSTPLVEYLLKEKGVDPNITMDATKPESKSALFFAIDNTKNKKDQAIALNLIDLLLAYGAQSPYAEKYVSEKISDKALKQIILKKLFCSDICKLIVNASDSAGITNIINSPAGKLVNLQTEKNKFFQFNVATADQPSIKNVTFLMLAIYQVAKNASDANKINNIMKTIQLWVNDHDVDINQPNSQEENPLIVALLEIAAHQNDPAAVKYLLETITTLVAHGAKTDITYQTKTTAQLAATVADVGLQKSIDNVLEITFGKADVDNLIDALKTKDQARINTLIATKIGLDTINLYNTRGDLTPLMAAAYYGNPDAVAALVQKKGVNLDLVSPSNNCSALRFAILYFVENKAIDESTRAAKVKQIVETLVKYGATPIINTNCDAIVAANSSLAAFSNIRDTLIRAQAVKYIMKGGGAALGDLLKKYSGANLSLETTINLAEPGKNPVFFTGNLLKIFLHYVKEATKDTSGYLGDLNSLLAISGMSKSIDKNTGKSMLSFATFNLEFFKEILSKINDDESFLVTTKDNTGSSILLDTAQTMATGSLNAAIYSLLTKIKDAGKKKSWVNVASKDGLKPVDAIIKRAGEFNATNKDMIASPLKQLKDAGAEIDTATINLVHALAPSDVKTAIETALDIPDHPVTPEEIIANIREFNATLEKIQSILKTVKRRR